MEGKGRPDENYSDDVLRYEESALYEEKIRRMESSIDSLRLSRRILMSLLEQADITHSRERERLLAENRRLRHQLASCARQLWRQNAAVDAEQNAAAGPSMASATSTTK